MREDLPGELREKLPHDIRLYMRNFWQHPNDLERPYDFKTDDGDYLYYLADDDGPLVPGNWGDIVVLNFARGCLKTTVASAAIEWGVNEFPMIEADVTAPRQDQFTEVMDRFKEHIKWSGLQQLRTKDNISHQKFERVLERENGDKVHAEADVKARSAWGEGDALRGLHGHVGVVDEFQDVDESMFSTFLEAVDQGVPQVDYFPVILIIGTPKMANSFFHDLWSMSDQKTWDPESRKWVQQAEPELFMPPEAKEAREEMQEQIARLEDADEDYSAEIAQMRDEMPDGFRVTGWHIDQYASPLHDDARIAMKKAKYTKRKFQNEVLAQFYTPEDDLLTEDDVEDALDYGVGWERARLYDDSTMLVAVDWGGGDGDDASDTVIGAAEMLADEERTIVPRRIEFLDPDMNKQDELERVEDYIRDFQADRVAVDEGYGAKQREDLQDGNNIWNTAGWDQVCGVIYGNIKDKDEPKFGGDASNFKDAKFCTVARTHMIEGMVADFKDGRFRIPADDLEFQARDGNGEKLTRQLTAPYTDLDETPGGKKRKKVMADRKDDAFHMFTYLWIAAEKFGSTRTLRKVGARRGH